MTTILIVEDELDAAEMLRVLLELEGYAANVSPNGAHALARIHEIRPALVICDVMMPIMDGPTFIRALRELPEYRATPVIVMSAVHEALLPAGGSHNAFVPKPMGLKVLLETVRRLLPASPA